MKTIGQIVDVLPYGQNILHGAEEVYDYSKQKSMQVYKSTKSKIIESKKEYLDFRKNVQNTMCNIAEETVNQVLGRLQNFIGVQPNQKNEDFQHAYTRIQIIIQTLYRQYILKNIFQNNQRVQEWVKLGRNYTSKTLAPLYIHLKATMVVSKEMFVQFVQYLLNQVKITYQHSKDCVVMFVGGEFSEENMKKKAIEGIENFKDFTIKFVNKGLQIKVDRQSLIDNYDQFTIKLIQIVKQLKTKGKQNMEEIKKKSKDLYKQTIKRIKAKQFQLKVNLTIQENKQTRICQSELQNQ